MALARDRRLLQKIVIAQVIEVPMAVDQHNLVGSLSERGDLGLKHSPLLRPYASIQDVQGRGGTIHHDGWHVTCFPQKRGMTSLDDDKVGCERMNVCEQVIYPSFFIENALPMGDCMMS